MKLGQLLDLKVPKKAIIIKRLYRILLVDSRELIKPILTSKIVLKLTEYKPKVAQQQTTVQKHK